MTEATSTSPGEPPSKRRPGLLAALIAPAGAIVDPRRHAGRLAACRVLPFWITFMLYAALVAWTIVVLTVWSDTVWFSWTQNGTGPDAGFTTSVEQRTWSEAWAAWRGREYGPGPVGFSLILIGVIFAAHLVAAWLFLVDVHEGGPVTRSFGRAFRGVACSSGVLLLITAVFGTAIVLVSHDALVHRRYDWEQQLVLAGFAFFGAQVSWIRRSCEGARSESDAPELPPMCEDCGYDLTHRPDSGRCTECGGDINLSLTPGARRTASRWALSPEVAANDPAGHWTLRLGGTMCSVILEPIRFYRGRTMRTHGGRAVSFARWQYLSIFAATWVWIIACSGVVENLDGMLPLWLPLAFASGSVSLGWLVHRTVGGIALSYCFLRGVLPDPRYAREVFAYETAFLWVFCLYNGSLMTSMFLFDTWMSDLFGFGPAWLLGIPPEVAAVLFGNGAIVLGWLYRYRLIIPQVRWANF